MSQDRNDPVIAEIREVRTRISSRVDHDPMRLGDCRHPDSAGSVFGRSTR
jgi:hypothetical protein